MIDFGLSGLLDRVEKTFGKGAASFLTVTIALTIVTVCCGLIASTFYGGVVFMTDTVGKIGWLESVLRFVVGASQLSVLTGIWVIAVNFSEAKRDKKRAATMVAEAEALLARVQNDTIRYNGRLLAIEDAIIGLSREGQAHPGSTE